MLLTSRLLAGVPHGFSTREGGVSAGPFASLNLGRSVGDEPERVAENGRRFAAALGLRPGQIRSANQVHGEAILEETEAARGEEIPPALGDADAVITGERGVAVGVRTADCVPILLYAPDVGAVAAVHAGWRGAVLAIAARAVAQLSSRYGADPRRMLAAIGPSIRGCCYEVGEDVARRFDERFGAGVTLRSGGGGPRLDLAEANRRALAGAGLPPQNVEVLGHCTACEPDRFFSHRRDHGRSGRHLSAIVLP